MSIVEDALVDITDVDTPDLPHHACCVEDRFFCGAPFHPEMEEDDPEEPHCVECDEIVDMMECARGHEHCPFTGRICP